MNRIRSGRGFRGFLMSSAASLSLPIAAFASSENAEVLPSTFADVAPASAASSSFGLDVPAYHSLPGATAKIYLDFDGDVTLDWGSYHPGTTPAYSTDTDTANFSQSELDNIHEIWMRVSEKFSPFNIDVTTVDPGALNDRQSVRVVIGGDGKNGQTDYWVGQRAGGIAYLGSFTNDKPNTVYVFPGNLGNGLPRYVGDAAAHETGHSFGLSHQSLYSLSGALVNEYNPGTADKAPLMGRSYESARGQWWWGPSTYYFLYQDDLYTISDTATNGFGYRPDDYGDSIATAAPLTLTGGSFHAAGVITRTSDKDFFSFDLTGPADLALTLDVAPFGAMLDGSLALYAPDGTLLQSVATASLGEVLFQSLLPGTYDIAVLSAGAYGDIGQFTLSGVLSVPEPSATGLVVALLVTSFGKRRSRMG